MTVRIGTSGWHYPHWRGVFYPPDLPASRYLAFYAREFATVEVNNTFYQLPAESTVGSWASAVGDDFCFAVKASYYITHRKKLRDPAKTLPRFEALWPLLGDKLGPVLFQLPPRFKLNLERLAAFVDSLPSGRRYAFEFRDKSWFEDSVRALLSDRGAAFCLYDMAGLVTPEWISGPFVYLRLHGTSAAYGGSYSDDMLKSYASRIHQWEAQGKDVYCYFNNDTLGHAVANARTLIALTEAIAGG